MPKPPKLFWEKEEILLLKVRNRSNRVFLFEESFFRQNNSMQTWSALLTSPMKIYRQKTEIVSVIIRKPKELWLSRKNCICSIASNRHEECSLDNAPKKYRQKTKNISLVVRKRSKHSFLEKKPFPSTCFYENLECSVGKPFGKSLEKRRKIYTHFWKRFKNIYTFFRKNSPPKGVPMDT